MVKDSSSTTVGGEAGEQINHRIGIPTSTKRSLESWTRVELDSDLQLQPWGLARMKQEHLLSAVEDEDDGVCFEVEGDYSMQWIMIHR